MVQIVAYTDQYTLSTLPAEVLLTSETISDGGGGAGANRRTYHMDDLPTGTTNLRAVLTVIGGTAAGVKTRGVIDTGGSDFWNHISVGQSAGFTQSFLDPQSGDFGNATEILVNQFGQDPLVYSSAYGGPAARASHLTIENHSTNSNTIRVDLYGRPRGRTLTVPIPPGTVPGDRVVIVFLAQTPTGGDDLTHISAAPISVYGSSYPDAQFAPILGHAWLSDYTHNHQFTGAYPVYSGTTVPVDERLSDVTGSFQPQFDAESFQDPITGFFYNRRLAGDDQTREGAPMFVVFQSGAAGPSLTGSAASAVMVGSSEYRLPAALPGALPGDPLPDPLTEYTFFVDGGDISLTDYLSVCTIVLRNDVGSGGGIYSPPYRLGTDIGSSLDTLLGLDGGNIESATLGGESVAPEPPPMEPQPTAANDLILTAYTYQGKASYGNPLGDVHDIIDADTSSVRMYSMGLYGNEADGSELGYRPIVNNNVAPEGWNTVGFDDSGWMTPASRPNSYGSHDTVTVLGLPYITSANPWAIPGAPIQYETVLWRMEFSLAGDGVHELDHTGISGFCAQMHGPMYLAVEADPILQPNARPAQDIEFGNIPLNRWQLDGGAIGAYLYGPNQYRTSIDGLPFDWYWATGVAHYVPSIVYGTTYCLSGIFYTWQSPDWVENTNPGGIQVRVEVVGTSFDGDAIGGLTDITSVSAFDPPLTNLISVRQEVPNADFHTWILTRELWAQTAGQRSEQGLPITYGFNRIPPFLPYPPDNQSYGFGTGFSFVWRDGGPRRSERGAHSSVQFVG